jgi:hypothetical protein
MLDCTEITKIKAIKTLFFYINLSLSVMLDKEEIMDSIRKIDSAKGHQQPLLNCCPLRVFTSKVCGILHTVGTHGIQS